MAYIKKADRDLPDQFIEKKTGGRFPFKIADVALRISEVWNDNNLIKKKKVKCDLTFEQILEIKRCKSDPEYFIETYLRIISVDDGEIPFKLYDYQREMIVAFRDNRFNIDLLPRQAGKTSVVAAFIVWYAIFHQSKSCAVLANKESQSQEIMDRIRLMIENLPFFMMPGVVEFNKMNITFDNGSKIFGSASGSSSVRGKTIALLYLDEMAFLAQDEDFFASTYPTIVSGTSTKVIITSTPNGARGVFYRLYQGAVAESNDYVPLKFIWSDVPGRDEEWARKTEEIQGKSKFRQEMCCEFIGSSNSLISGEVLERMQFRNPDNDDLYLSVYEEPKDKHIYFTIVDPSEGIGRDFSVITVFDITNIPYKQVCVYGNNNLDMMLLPTTIYSIATRYNNSYVLVESNTETGGMVNYGLWYELEYMNTILTSSDDTGLSVRINGKGAKPGVKTTKKTKGIGCANLKTLLENDKLEIYDQVTINELGTFVQYHNTYRADQDCHDDRVMTLVIFSWLVKQPFFIDLTNEDISLDILERQKLLSMSEIMPFGYIPQQSAVSLPDPYEQYSVYGMNGVMETYGNPILFEEWMRS